MYHKCEVLINESIPGKSEKEHKFQLQLKVMECTWQLHLTKQQEMQLIKKMLKILSNC